MKRLLKGISEANNFLLKENNIHEALQNCISALGKNIGIDRCYIFQNEIVNNELILNYEYEWCNNNTEPFIGNPELSGHSYDAFPGLFTPLSQNLPLYGLVKDSKNQYFKEVMEMQNIKAFLFTPIFSDGFFWGWIGFDDCENERIWTEDVVSTLHTVAHNIGLRLSQDNVTSKLENTLFELEFYMKSSKQAKWEWNIKTNEVNFSYNWFGMLGYEDDELEHSVATWESLLHPDDKVRIKQKVTDYINNKIEKYEGIIRIRHKNNDYIWVKYSALKILDCDGNVEKIIGTHIDINDIKEKEIELANQRNEYNHLINNLAEIIFKTDLKGNLFFLNDQWEKITEHSIESCLGTSIFNYFENFNIDAVKELLLHPIRKEVQLIKKNNGHIWGLVQLNIDFDNSTQKKIIIGSITDINDTINLKKQLEISEQKYKFIAENTSDLIMQHLNDGTITYVSQNAEKITGYQPDELINKNPYNFYHPEDIDAISKQHQNILNNKNEIITFRFRKKNGKYIWLETYTKTLLDEKNNIIGLQTSSRDITKRVKDKENVEKALEREKELNELKSGFVSMVSHQFRTPLSVIYSNLELLNFKIAKIEDEKKSEIDLIKNRIHNEVNRMTELMNNILIYGAFESNNLKIDLKEFHLNTFVENLIETYFFNEIDGRKIIFERDDYQPYIESDEGLLTHVLNNLISNSFKYSIGSSNPIIRITYLEKSFKIEVIDFGIGIPENEIKHMFQSFFRGSNTSTIKGSGLGLIIAKQFTELLNGTIWITSKENEFTTVTLKFPYKQKK